MHAPKYYLVVYMDKSSLACLFILLAAALLATTILAVKQHSALPAKEQPSISWAADLAPDEGYFVGNRASKIYHSHDCRYVERMLPRNEVVFETREEAEAQGYRRCEVCGY